MTDIRSLFDSTRALNRPIEKVITYLGLWEQRNRKPA